MSFLPIGLLPTSQYDTTLTPPGASRVPILRLQHLVYANSLASAAVAQRLWPSRPRRARRAAGR